MKICKKCQKQFPLSVVIKGKKHNLQKRLYCLDCSPFGKHNTARLHVHSQNHKKCGKCNQELELSMFCKRGNHLQSYCKLCNTKIRKIQQRNTKQKFVDYKGGQCAVCGYKKYLGALDFHHIDPQEKDSSLGRFSNYSFNKIKTELDKCILVCSNCHREIHGGHIQILTENSSSEDRCDIHFTIRP